MSDFARVSDVWKSFWQALEDEILAMGGHSWMLERLAKADVRPAIRELAKAVIKSATHTTRAVQEPPVRFDIAKAKEIWKAGELWENGSLPYCRFTLPNHQNQTRLIVGIGHGSRQVQVELDLVTLDCPQLHQAKEKPHEHLMHLALRAGVVSEVKYNEERGRVEFVLKPTPEMQRRHLWIYDGGKVVFSEWD